MIEPEEYGIKAPSILSQVLPQFDIVYGHMIDFFHNLQIVRERSPFLSSRSLTPPPLPFSPSCRIVPRSFGRAMSFGI